jgi:tetratricopeptide (TPR) repeat protein
VDLDNPVIKLCIEGTRAEYEGRYKDACTLYQLALEASKDDFEACVAAHYIAHCQENPEDILYWNLESLNRANAVKDERVKDFYPSLYVNLGRSYELIGNQRYRYYDSPLSWVSSIGVTHNLDGYPRSK